MIYGILKKVSIWTCCTAPSVHEKVIVVSKVEKSVEKNIDNTKLVERVSEVRKSGTNNLRPSAGKDNVGKSTVKQNSSVTEINSTQTPNH